MLLDLNSTGALVRGNFIGTDVSLAPTASGNDRPTSSAPMQSGGVLGTDIAATANGLPANAPTLTAGPANTLKYGFRRAREDNAAR